MKKRPSRAEVADLADRIKDARVYLPDSMPLDAVCQVGGAMIQTARLLLDKLEPVIRATTRVKTITVVPEDGERKYRFDLEYEHDCPNGVCDDCIGDD